jgi:hypothetical protein
MKVYLARFGISKHVIAKCATKSYIAKHISRNVVSPLICLRNVVSQNVNCEMLYRELLFVKFHIVKFCIHALINRSESPCGSQPAGNLKSCLKDSKVSKTIFTNNGQ